MHEFWRAEELIALGRERAAQAFAARASAHSDCPQFRSHCVRRSAASTRAGFDRPVLSRSKGSARTDCDAALLPFALPERVCDAGPKFRSH